jgi:hypothetical protein
VEEEGEEEEEEDDDDDDDDEEEEDERCHSHASKLCYIFTYVSGFISTYSHFVSLCS